MAMTELARAGLAGKSRSRKRVGDGNGATVCILPARDGYAAISPREDRQWAAWLAVMGSPDWGNDPRFATKARPGRQLGRAARADVGVEPPPRQAMDRRQGAGGPCAELSAARAGGTARARRSSRIAVFGATLDDRRAHGQGARRRRSG